MRVKVLFFGVLREIVGVKEEALELPGGSRLGEVFDHYAARHPRLREMASSIVMARNQTFSSVDTPVMEGDELALLPPVSGGSDSPDQVCCALTREPIDAHALSTRLVQPLDGAVVAFEGVVRNNSRGRSTQFLEYECYEPVALAQMAAIGRELVADFAITRAGMIHRLGRLEIGETSVAIVTVAPHRRPAFEAALEGINRLKRRVPIWKKEYFVDGEVWVEGEWDANVPVVSPR